VTERPLEVRVAVVTQAWPLSRDGGVAMSEVLAQGFATAGVPVEVWTPGGRGRAKPVGNETDTRVQALPGPWWRKWGRSHWKKGATERLAEFSPHLIVATSWKPLPGVLDALEEIPRPSRPVLAAFAGSELGDDLSASAKNERREALQGPVRWLAYSPRAHRFVARNGVPPGRVFDVPAAVMGPKDPPDRSLRQRPRRLLTVAPLIPSAGQDKVIEALARLAAERPRLKYELVGDGPDEARLKALAEAQGVADRVVFRGRLEGAALEHAYARADVFVLAGRRAKAGEPEPDFVTLFLEAGARGLPVLGSGGGENAAGLEDGVTAKVLTRPSDAAEVADGLDSMLKLPLALAGLGRSGRRRFEQSGRPAHLAGTVLDLARGWLA